MSAASARDGGRGSECRPGTERCDCQPDGSCDRGLSCFSDLCVDAQGSCPFAGDGICDEPDLCPAGTDSDCCASPNDGVCEEMGRGGECPDGTDYLDCGYCPAAWVDDGLCDEVRVGGTCPENSDGGDCCATPRNGTCEEESLGGPCDDLTDWFDCGYCPEVWLEDGLCDETPALWACPDGSDASDCAP